MATIKEVFGKSYQLKVVTGHENSPVRVKAFGECVFTKKPYETASFPLKSFNSWLSGKEHIQLVDGLKQLSSSDREFLISGTGPEFWAQIERMENE